MPASSFMPMGLRKWPLMESGPQGGPLWAPLPPPGPLLGRTAGRVPVSHDGYLLPPLQPEFYL